MTPTVMDFVIQLVTLESTRKNESQNKHLDKMFPYTHVERIIPVRLF